MSSVDKAPTLPNQRGEVVSVKYRLKKITMVEKISPVSRAAEVM
jgi:hypothetical protein